MTIARERMQLPIPRWALRGALLLLIGFGLIACLVLSTENYFVPFPQIDTRFAPQYSEAQFNTIRIGMSRDEVLQRLGPPLNGVDQPFYWTYTEDGASPFWDFAWLVRGVQFDEEGRVIGISSFVAYD